MLQSQTGSELPPDKIVGLFNFIFIIMNKVSLKTLNIDYCTLGL